MPGVEARDAYDEEIPIYVYTLYTQEQLDEMNKPSIDQRVADLEQQLAAYEVAYMEGVNAA